MILFMCKSGDVPWELTIRNASQILKFCCTTMSTKTFNYGYKPTRRERRLTFRQIKINQYYLPTYSNIAVKVLLNFERIDYKTVF